MTRKRRSYSDAFKRDAVKLITKQGYTVAEAAESLGVHANVLRKWKQKLEAESSAGKNGSLNGEEREELRRLRTRPGGPCGGKRGVGWQTQSRETCATHRGSLPCHRNLIE